MPDLKPDDIILRSYRIEKSIGQGAFGQVYLATHTGLNGKRAVKVLLRDDIGVGSSDYDEYRNRFRQESQLMEWFNHSNIIRVYDFHEEDNILHLIMEYADGGSLRQRMDQLKKEGCFFSMEETVKIGIDIANGLAALHQKDVVHRDLKPSNILFDANGRAIVADLGLAQVPGGASMRSQLSVPKPHPGTPAYMSPEQETAGSYLRPASDIYTFGLILFEMLTGRGYKSLRPGTRLKSLSPDSPTWLDDLLARMLSENPKDRPWDGAEAATALEQRIGAPISSPAAPPTMDHEKKAALPDDASVSAVEPIAPTFSWEPEKSPKNVPVKNQRTNSSVQKTDKLTSLLQRSWLILIPALLILGIVYLNLLLNNPGNSEKKPSTASLSQNPIIYPTATQEIAGDYRTTLLGKWIVTDTKADQNRQAGFWQDVGNTVEFFSTGEFQMVSYDGFRGGGTYRVENDRVFFAFNGEETDSWKITFYNSGKSMVLNRVNYTESIIFNKE